MFAIPLLQNAVEVESSLTNVDRARLQFIRLLTGHRVELSAEKHRQAMLPYCAIARFIRLTYDTCCMYSKSIAMYGWREIFIEYS